MHSCLKYLGLSLSQKAGRTRTQLWVSGMSGLLLNARQVRRDAPGAINYPPYCTWPNQAGTSWKPLLLKTSYKLPHPKTGEEYELPATSYSSNSPRHSSRQMQHQTQELQEPYQFEVSLFPEDFSVLLLESLMHSADRFKEVRSDWLWPYTWASDSILQSCHAVLNSQLSGRLFENELKICWNFL